MDAVLLALTELLQPMRLLMLFTGVGCGLLIGMIPGLSGIVGMVLLVPFTYHLDPYSAVALLLGMGSVTTTSDTVTAVLFGVPGTVAAAATVIDGHAMARKGEAQRAFGAAFSASMIGGVFGAVVLAAAIPLLQPWVRLFGSPELFAIAVFGLSMVASLSTDSPLRGLLAVSAGLLFASVGLDNQTATHRWTLGLVYLWDGLPLVPVFLGLFAIPELEALWRRAAISHEPRAEAEHGGLRRGILDSLTHLPLVLKMSALGASLGSIPGIGSAVIDWIAYGSAKRTAREPHTFGEGDVRGVIAPEAANNAKEGGALVPTLAFGIPGSASMTILLGALMVQGLTPGPEMLRGSLDVTFAMVFSIALANVLGGGACLLFARRLGQVATLPSGVLVPVVVVFVTLGAFQATRDSLDLAVLMVFGVVGLAMRAAKWSRPAFALGFVLGPTIERYFFISHSIYGWSWLLRPMVGLLLALALATVLRSLPEWLRATRQRGTSATSQDSPVVSLASGLAVLLGGFGSFTSAGWQPGAGLFPQIVFAAMAIAGSLSLAASYLARLRAPKSQHSDDLSSNAQSAALRFLLLAGAYPALLLCFGWLVATPVFAMVALSLGGGATILVGCTVSVGLTLFVWMVFDRLLTVPWPAPLLALW